MGNQEWAFKHLCQHLMKKMPKHTHVVNDEDADVVFLVSPEQLEKIKDRKRVIQHLDSNRR